MTYPSPFLCQFPDPLKSFRQNGVGRTKEVAVERDDACRAENCDKLRCRTLLFMPIFRHVLTRVSGY